jgi:hypothetical protein
MYINKYMIGIIFFSFGVFVLIICMIIDKYIREHNN